MHGRARVLRRDLHGRVLLARRGPANQKRRLDAAPLHLLGDKHHLVERRRDQTAQADDVSLVLGGRRQDLVE